MSTSLADEVRCCLAAGCATAVPLDQWICEGHLRLLPGDLRDDVRSYRGKDLTRSKCGRAALRLLVEMAPRGGIP